MKILTAQFFKDVATLRALLIAWGACLIVALTRYIPISSGSAHMGLAITAIFAMVALIVLSALLAMQVIHADALTEPDAFWRTRPIPRHTLLAEKAGFVLLLVAGCLLANSAGGKESYAPFLLSVATFTGAFVAFAAISSSFLQMALNFLCIAAPTKLIAALLNLRGEVTTTAHGQSWNFSMGSPAGLDNPAAVWVSVLFLLGVVIIIAWQYLTSRTQIARIALFILFLLTAFLQNR